MLNALPPTTYRIDGDPSVLLQKALELIPEEERQQEITAALEVIAQKKRRADIFAKLDEMSTDQLARLAGHFEAGETDAKPTINELLRS